VRDLRAVNRIDSASPDSLISVAALAGSEISLSLVSTELGRVVGALSAAGLVEIFEIFPTVQDAWDHPSR
jgi:anti-anti-sigma regulatory factor